MAKRDRTRRGTCAAVGEDELLQDVIDDLGLPRQRPVVVLAGWAKGMTGERRDSLQLLFQDAVSPIVDGYGGIVVDGGTDTGVMQIAGRAFTERRSKCRLVGVAPEGRVVVDHESELKRGQAHPEPNHDVLLVPGSRWGKELPYMAALVDRLKTTSGVLVVIVGGHSGTRSEFELALSRGWPVLAIAGSGGVADEIAAENHDTDLVAVAPLDDLPAVRRNLRWRLDPDRNLRRAWSRAWWLDKRAVDSQPRFHRLRNTVLVLGLVSTIAGLSAPYAQHRLMGEFLRLLLVLLPVLAATMLSWISRRRKDRRWVSTRAAAEAMKREIYRYRCRSGPYSAKDAKLSFANTMAVVERRLAEETPASVVDGDELPWPPDLDEFVHGDDELLGLVDSSSYLVHRVRNQIEFYSGKVNGTDRKVAERLKWVFAMSIAATVLAAAAPANEYRAGLVAAAAVAAATGATAAAWLGYDQLEQQVDRMAVTVSGLRGIEARWAALSDAARERTLSGMADDAEGILEAENIEWSRSLRQSQQMFDLQQSTEGRK